MNRPPRNRRVSSLPGAASNPLTPPGSARYAFRISIALHLGLVLALLLGSLCAKGCASTKKEPEELIFVDFTVSAPPPPPAEATPDEPEPPLAVLHPARTSAKAAAAKSEIVLIVLQRLI